jgi:hypothetical protein
MDVTVLLTVILMISAILNAYMLGFDQGKKAMAKQVSDLWQETPAKEKKKKFSTQRTKSSFTDLLDPITPLDQKMDRMFETLKNKGEEVDLDDGK